MQTDDGPKRTKEDLINELVDAVMFAIYPAGAGIRREWIESFIRPIIENFVF